MLKGDASKDNVRDGFPSNLHTHIGEVSVSKTIDGDASIISLADGEPKTDKILDGENVIIEQVHIDGEYYDGPTAVTPTRETQVLNTMGKTVTQNITVNPIPKNYGLITWNGYKITVS